MNQTLIIIVAIFVIFIIIVKLISAKKQSISPTAEPKESISYHYTRKEYLMTQSEGGFLRLLFETVGTQYYVVPQVHLSAIFDHKAKGQNWKAAFKHINGKSVDFVICEKASMKPLIAIEVDESSHDADDRRARDTEVERIFSEANLPLLRFDQRSGLSREVIAQQILTSLASTQPQIHNSLQDQTVPQV